MFQVNWSRFHLEYPVTFTIVLANVLVFLGINLGLMLPPVLENSQLSPSDLWAHFAHMDLFHLVSNLIMAVFIGLFLEKTLGHFNYATLIAFIWVSLTVLMFMVPSGMSLGFSGIGLGLLCFGFLYFRHNKTISQFLWPLLFLNILIGVLPGISGWGHFLGAVCGAFGYIIWQVSHWRR